MGPVAFLVPGVRVSLPATKPEFRVDQSATLAEHLRRRRRELGLTTGEAAKRVGVRRWTFGLWEKECEEVSDRFYPSLIRFLGLEPWPRPQTLGERLQAERRRRGLGAARAAGVIGVQFQLLGQLEAGEVLPNPKVQAKLDRFLNVSG